MAIVIERRKFIGALGGAQPHGRSQRGRNSRASCRPSGSWARRRGLASLDDAFVVRLRELGWIEGRTIAIEYRWSEGRPERVAEIAAEFVRQKVDVIVTYGVAVPTLKQATTVIPIVFAIAGDPVGSGLVASLARPGGNVTGMSLQTTDIAGKRLELLRELSPVFAGWQSCLMPAIPQPVPETGEVQAAARKLGLEIAPHEIRRAEDIAPVFEALKAQADALYVVDDTLLSPTERNHHACARRAAATIFANRDM